jgi:hypothetical protein
LRCFTKYFKTEDFAMADNNEDWKNDPDLYDQESGREIAASGYPAPTMEEAVHELGIIARLLSTHGCATTRDLVAAASVAVDAAHRDAHSATPDGIQEQITNFGHTYLDPVQKALNEKVKSIESLEDRAKFYARMASIFLQVARVMGTNAIIAIKDVQDASPDAPTVAIPAVPVPTTSASASPEDAVKNLLDMPIKSKYTM